MAASTYLRRLDRVEKRVDERAASTVSADEVSDREIVKFIWWNGRAKNAHLPDHALARKWAVQCGVLDEDWPPTPEERLEARRRQIIIARKESEEAETK